jgi:hypothetical protein
LGTSRDSPWRVLYKHRPANTIMQVVRFIDPEWLVEIEADAVVEG